MSATVIGRPACFGTVPLPDFEKPQWATRWKIVQRPNAFARVFFRGVSRAEEHVIMRDGTTLLQGRNLRNFPDSQTAQTSRA